MSWTWSQLISEEIFKNKYQFHRKSVEQVFDDVATVISEPEKKGKRKEIKDRFYEMMINGRFIPAGRILANAWPGSKIKNYINCYTIGIEDDMDAIFDALKEDAMISKVGGGVGFDVSKLRPKGTPLSVGGEASGPISFLRIFNESAKIIMTGGQRRAAHIALMDISHPDIEDFITCKQGDRNKALTQFNISVKLTDKFMSYVKKDLDWDLVFEGKVYKTIKAKQLYNLLVKNAYEHNEPGIFNVDTVNKYNNGWWLYRIHQCNPCGEIIGPEYFSCDLGSHNFTAYINNPFCENSFFDFEKLASDIELSIRFLDNVLDIVEYPLEKLQNRALTERRIGLGFTGVADAFAMMRIRYGSEESKALSEQIGRTFRNSSYRASVNLAKEKGPFELCNKENLLKSGFIKKLPKDIRSGIKEYGLRNISLNTCPPTGTISLSVGQNCSSGIEPIFALEYTRRIRTKSDPDVYVEQEVYDYAWGLWQSLIRNDKESVIKYLKGELTAPDFFITAADIKPQDAIDIQSIFQNYVDQSISKTLNLPKETTFDEYKDLFEYAYNKGLKGFTTFFAGGSMKGVLEVKKEEDIIERRESPKRPKDLDCDIHQMTFKGDKMIVLVGKLNGSLYEIFVDDDVNGSIDIGKHKDGVIRKVGKGRYDLLVQNGGERVVVENLSKNFGGTYGSLARLVSMALRHGTPLQFIVDQLTKSKEFLGFERVVSRVLKKYIKDGEVDKTSTVCLECGNTELIYQEGCLVCSSCGNSLCS